MTVTPHPEKQPLNSNNPLTTNCLSPPLPQTREIAAPAAAQEGRGSRGRSRTQDRAVRGQRPPQGGQAERSAAPGADRAGHALVDDVRRQRSSSETKSNPAWCSADGVGVRDSSG